MKKLFEYKFAKKASIVSIVLLILNCVLFKLANGEDESISIILLICEDLSRITHNILNKDLQDLFWIYLFIMIPTVIIKIVDYKNALTNYPDGENSEKAITAKNKVYNVLGIIVLPAWTIITVYIFLGSTRILDHFFTDYIPFAARVILIAVPTLFVIAYSLALDVLGLKSKTKAAAPQEA